MTDRTPYPYVLRIMGDAPEQIREDDPELWAEIERDREPHDDDNGAVLRWLGGLLSETEDALNALLPANFYAKIEEVPSAPFTFVRGDEITVRSGDVVTTQTVTAVEPNEDGTTTIVLEENDD
jgi:hypothetical protein